jgi:predicted metal-dependent phosphoesterase TrpH
MVYADLHVHTTISDGRLEPAEVPAVAREAGLDVVAVTDHDRLHPTFESPMTRMEDVLVINGIELRVNPGPQRERVDLLGYGVTPTPSLQAEVDRLQADRQDRGARIVRNIEDRLNISLDLEVRAGLGRPHIARAVVENEATEYDDTDAVFAELIGEDCPCYVARDVTDFETGISLLSDACAIVGLAHPLRYDDPAGALELCANLDAVERHYPYSRPVAQAVVDRAIDTYDLLRTGGSDAHGRDLAVAGLSAAGFEPLRRFLPGS